MFSNVKLIICCADHRSTRFCLKTLVLVCISNLFLFWKNSVRLQNQDLLFPLHPPIPLFGLLLYLCYTYNCSQRLCILNSYAILHWDSTVLKGWDWEKWQRRSATKGMCNVKALHRVADCGLENSEYEYNSGCACYHKNGNVITSGRSQTGRLRGSINCTAYFPNSLPAPIPKLTLQKLTATLYSKWTEQKYFLTSCPELFCAAWIWRLA